jgi:mannose-6-phosphate isomerase
MYGFLELWMGVHPNGPSVLAETGQSLADHLAADPDLLGEPVKNMFNNQLPFLFKVLRYVCHVKLRR